MAYPVLLAMTRPSLRHNRNTVLTVVTWNVNRNPNPNPNHNPDVT